MKGQQESLTTIVVKSGLADQGNRNSVGSHQESWLTPKSRDYRGVENHILKNGKNIRATGQVFSVVLPTQAMMEEQKSWATPQTRDAKGAEGRMIRECHFSDLPSQTEVENTGTWNRNNGKLNPRWVETLMGLPVGWTMPSCASPMTIEPTNSGSLEMESYQQPQNSPSEHFGKN